MAIPETDARRFRILQIMEVAGIEQPASRYILDTLRGSMHFHVSDGEFQEDLAWLADRGLVRTGPLDEEVWVALTAAGREVIDLTQPGPALRSVNLGRGAHLTLTGEPIDAAKRQALAEAARELVRALLDDAAPAGDIGPGPDRHLGAREAS